MLGTIIVLVILTPPLLLVGCQRWIYYPGQFRPADTAAAIEGEGVEAWTIETDQGDVPAWLLRPSAGFEPPHPAVVFGYGNGSLAGDWFGPLAYYRDMGVAVLLVEFRGYGAAAGSPSEQRIVSDFEQAYDRLVADTSIDHDRVFFHGVSMGGGIVASLARRREPAGLILQASYTSLPDIAAEAVPVPLIKSWVLDKYDTHAYLETYEGPVLIVHGERDTTIPIAHGQRNHETAKRSEFVAFDTDHNWWVPEEFFPTIEDWLERNGLLPTATDSKPAARSGANDSP